MPNELKRSLPPDKQQPAKRQKIGDRRYDDRDKGSSKGPSKLEMHHAKRDQEVAAQKMNAEIDKWKQKAQGEGSFLRQVAEAAQEVKGREQMQGASDIPPVTGYSQNIRDIAEYNIHPRYQWGDQTKIGVYLEYIRNRNLKVFVPKDNSSQYYSKGLQYDLKGAFKVLSNLDPEITYIALSRIRQENCVTVGGWNVTKKIEPSTSLIE